jgi:CBS domain-containing protein
MLVKDLMKKPYASEKDMNLSDAARIMTSKGIGSLIFVDKGKVKGILTERDLLKNFGKGVKAHKAMSKAVITIGPEEDVNKALETMQNNKIKRLPVIDNKLLVGIISLTDIATHADEIGEDFFFN